MPKQDKNDLKKELVAKFGTSRNTTQNTSVRNGAEKTEKTEDRHGISEFPAEETGWCKAAAG